MEAIAPGKDHHQFSLGCSTYTDTHNEYEHALVDRSMHDYSGSAFGAAAGPYMADGSGCDGEESSGSPNSTEPLKSEGKMSNRNAQGWANGYCSNAAAEQRLSTELANEENPYDPVENCGTVVNPPPINGKSNEKLHDDQLVKNNSAQSEDSDFGLIGNFNSQCASPPEQTGSMEVSEYDVSQCYSPGDWSSRASTDSALSTSASPQLAALPSPAYNRCWTAPTVPSSTLSLEEATPNLSRSKTDKEKKPRFTENLCHTPYPAERLSERKRKKIIENLVKIKNDGTVEVDVDRGSKIAPTLFDLDVSDHLASDTEDDFEDPIEVIPSYLEIAMLIVGTRGDVQPFVAIGKRLRDKGHRVRLATHANFRNFVTSNGLEFYPLGGDPKILAGYMVKNKGFLPSNPSEISIQKKQLRAIIHSLLPACTKPDGDSGAPFRATAIIANPPAYGHVHVAEYLDVPLHIYFTMPWTPTSEFPHPLARVKRHAGYKMSYHVVDSLMWWAMRGLINEFRVKELKLNPMTYFNTNKGSIAHLPTGYIWSPNLVPKPKDWGPRVDVVGFCFLSLADNYMPPDALVKWLAEGEKPIYVGFGSIPLEHPGSMTEVIVRALQETKQRGIIDKGWGGLGNLKDPPNSIFLLENCPHDWLFPQCAAVVHHGGAGTTAAGLKAGCPTTIVPFFGDQPFWGERVFAKGVGPAPLPVQQFTCEKLVQAIKFMKDPEVKERAQELAKLMEEEDGVGGAVDTFYRHLVRRLTQSTMALQRLSFFQTAVVRLQRLWCLPWCFE